MTSADKYPVSLAPNEGWDQRILVCHCGDMVDCFIIVSDRYVILVDTMLNPQTASAMLDIAGDYLEDGLALFDEGIVDDSDIREGLDSEDEPLGGMQDRPPRQ